MNSPRALAREAWEEAIENDEGPTGAGRRFEEKAEEHDLYDEHDPDKLVAIWESVQNDTAD